MTHIHQVAVKQVTQQLINMLQNNIIEDNGTESFESWCESGAVFAEHPSYEAECIDLMEKVAPLIDELTFTYLNFGY